MEQLIGYGMLATVPWAIWKYWSLTQKVKEAEKWPQADGEIISSEIRSGASGTYDNPNTVFKADVVYSYEVGARERRNNKIVVGGQLELSWKSKAEALCRRYPVGKKVVVHYNPRKPAESLLELREELSRFYLVGAAIFGFIGYNFFI